MATGAIGHGCYLCMDNGCPYCRKAKPKPEPKPPKRPDPFNIVKPPSNP